MPPPKRKPFPIVLDLETIISLTPEKYKCNSDYPTGFYLGFLYAYAFNPLGDLRMSSLCPSHHLIHCPLAGEYIY